MQQRVEALAGAWVGKYDVRQGGTIEDAVSDRLRPNASDFTQTVAIGGHDFARNRVRIDDECTQIRK